MSDFCYGWELDNLRQQQELIQRENAVGRMEIAIDPDCDEELMEPLNVYVFKTDQPEQLLVCQHCKEVIYDFPLIEIGPVTGANFHADRNECAAASIAFQIEHDSVQWIITGPDAEDSQCPS